MGELWPKTFVYAKPKMNGKRIRAHRFHEFDAKAMKNIQCNSTSTAPDRHNKRKEEKWIPVVRIKIHIVQSLADCFVKPIQVWSEHDQTHIRAHTLAIVNTVCGSNPVSSSVKSAVRSEFQDLQDIEENSFSRRSWLIVLRDTFFLTFRLMERTWRTKSPRYTNS